MKRTCEILPVVAVMALNSCAMSMPPGSDAGRKPELTRQKRFWVYQDSPLNSWIPGNWMPEEAGKIIATFDTQCKDHPKSGTRCIHVRIDKWQSPYWCGVAFAVPNPKDIDKPYWGEEKTVGWDLRGAKRVVFWARAPKPCSVRFKVCILGDKKYGDSATFPVQTEFITLTPKWKQYSIDLKGVNLSRVVTGFCFVTNRNSQPEPNQPVEFYLDSIYWQYAPPVQRKAK